MQVLCNAVFFKSQDLRNLCRVYRPYAKANCNGQWILNSTCFLPGWSGAEIKCTVHNALPKPPHKLVQQSRQKALKAYCTNMYTVLGTFIAFCTHVFGGEIWCLYFPRKPITCPIQLAPNRILDQSLILEMNYKNLHLQLEELDHVMYLDLHIYIFKLCIMLHSLIRPLLFLALHVFMFVTE